jgi:predicted metal-binding membrane protein
LIPVWGGIGAEGGRVRGRGPDAGVTPVYAAARARLGIVAALCVVAGVGWAWTAHEMRGMDAGPWTSLGSLGWFLGVWVVMMAAMMFPSVTPTVALYACLTHSPRLRPWLFALGYLLTWAAAGLVAYALGVTATTILRGGAAWGNAGRELAGAALFVAAIYELSPLKEVCLRNCRRPFMLMVGSWRDGSSGAVRMGAKNGAWCVGCCWALMVSLFALGVMSLWWMAFVAASIALQKTAPWPQRTLMHATSTNLLVLALLVLAIPGALPGLTIPGNALPMQ